jgi:hypothetical protein
MSLFENDRYRWRETFFLMFLAENHPSVGAMQKVLSTLGSGVEISEARGEDGAKFESLTLIAHEDNAAMDIVYSSGEDVWEQREELIRELKSNVDGEEEVAKLKRIRAADARLEIFHFEEAIWDPDMDENDEMLDPGTVLTVLELLADFCDGVAIDPQSGTFI